MSDHAEITLLQTADKHYKRYRVFRSLPHNIDATRIELAMVHVDGKAPVYVGRFRFYAQSVLASTGFAPPFTIYRGSYISGGANAFNSASCKLWSAYPDINPGANPDGGMNVLAPGTAIVATLNAHPIDALGGASVGPGLCGPQTEFDPLDFPDYIVLQGTEALFFVSGPIAVGDVTGSALLTFDWFQFDG